MATTLKFTRTNESVTVIDLTTKKTHTVPKGNVNFANLTAALDVGDEDTARKYLTVGSTVETWTNGLFRLVNGKVKHAVAPEEWSKLEDLPDSLSERIFAMITKGDDPASLLNFWTRLSKNPSWRSVNQLWGFLANKNIPLDQDGYILAYKAVNRDWTDCHSGKIVNSVGSVHEMPRNKISDDANEACHFGFHVGALGYAQSFGPSDRRMIICKVDPADVVCIPYDCGMQKMRTCKYEVIGVHGAKMSDTTHDTRKDPATKKAAAVTKPKKATPPAKAAKLVATDKHKFDDFNSMQLMEQLLPDLRTYAANNLHIVGASKIPGGKVALVAKIEEVRG